MDLLEGTKNDHKEELKSAPQIFARLGGLADATEVGRAQAETPLVARYMNAEANEDKEMTSEGRAQTAATPMTMEGTPVQASTTLNQRTVMQSDSAALRSLRKKAPPTTQTSGRSQPLTWYYAVAVGKDGQQGVYESWAGAAALVNGVSGAVFKKFRDEDAAVDFVLTHQPKNTYHASRENTTHPVQPRNTQNSEDQGTSQHYCEYIGTRPAPVKTISREPIPTKSSLQKALEHLGNQPEMLAVPTAEMMSPDPSLKKEDALLGLDIGSEDELRMGLTPPGLTEVDGRKLTKKMLDIVSLPGTLSGSTMELPVVIVQATGFVGSRLTKTKHFADSMTGKIWIVDRMTAQEGNCLPRKIYS